MLGIVLHTRNDQGRFELTEVPEPPLSIGHVVVDVEAFSINPGEARLGLSGLATGAVIGWDFVGRVNQSSDQSNEIQAGDRVVGFVRSGAWAERVAAPARSVARVPDAVRSEVAATLPTAGLTALYSLDHASALSSRRVLVTSATGTVGRFACQIAKQQGAYVVAASRSGSDPERPPIPGADRHIRSDEISKEDPFDIVIELTGGSALASAMVRLQPGGNCVSVSGISPEPTTFDAETFMSQWGATLRAFGLYQAEQARPAREALTRLLDLVTSGRLDAPEIVHGMARDADAFARAVVSRQIKAKPVLTFGGRP